MFDHQTAEFRHDVATSRIAALGRSAEPFPPGTVRRSLASALARIRKQAGDAGNDVTAVTSPIATWSARKDLT